MVVMKGCTHHCFSGADFCMGAGAICLGPGRTHLQLTGNVSSGATCVRSGSVHLGVLPTSQRLVPWFQLPDRGMTETAMPLPLAQVVQRP